MAISAVVALPLPIVMTPHHRQSERPNGDHTSRVPPKRSNSFVTCNKSLMPGVHGRLSVAALQVASFAPLPLSIHKRHAPSSTATHKAATSATPRQIRPSGNIMRVDRKDSLIDLAHRTDPLARHSNLTRYRYPLCSSPNRRSYTDVESSVTGTGDTDLGQGTMCASYLTPRRMGMQYETP